MDKYARHQRVWRALYFFCHRWICRKFNLTHEDLRVEGPVILIPNHVTTWDPLLVAMSLKDKQAYYVASEHIFRWGLRSRLIDWLVEPIPRRKAALGLDTVKICLRHLREGRSVCIFAEGEQCWDGRTGHVFPATGKLVKRSGATLVTYRLEGGYLSLPRWGRGVRRGRMHGHPVRIYPPEELAGMTPAEINAAIDRDIWEDAWERQRAEPAAYRGKNRAVGLERAMYLCPGCGAVGTLRTEDDRIFCGCGLDLRFTEEGLFQPPEPFETIVDWERWQAEALRRRAFVRGEDGLLFSDEAARLSRVGDDHSETPLGQGTLAQYEDRLVCAGRSFPLDEIGSMAIVQTDRLLFSCRDEYYEILAENGINLRKYLEIWNGR